MLSISKTTDYALIALASLRNRPNQLASAKQIARAHELPTALVMKILKLLQQRGIVASGRGAHGGYRLLADVERLSLWELIAALDEGASDRRGAAGASRLAAPSLQALHYRLVQFLKDVKVSDLITAGRRIDVPLEMVRCGPHAATTN
jgi:Rrf2 family protein